nr:family 10 glycosylhydrolase [Hoylesella enoeca]
MKRVFPLLLSILFVGVIYARADVLSAAPKYEVRAVWLTTIGGLDWPHCYARSQQSAAKQQRELCHTLDRLKQAGINTVLMQTRIRGTMIYPSQYEPWDGCLSGIPGQSPGYDALKFAVDQCHKRGMEIQAWVVTVPVGKWDGMGCRRLRQRLPGLIRRIGAEGYMNPEDTRTSSWLADICDELTSNYDIDGIHLDYIRYPETWPIKISRDRARAHITNIVRTVYTRIKARKPWVKLSCSPVGKHDDLSRFWSHGWNAYTKVCQDAQGWLRAGIMDELFPMMYFQGNQFYPFAIDWAEQSNGRIIAPGLGTYFLSPREADWPLETITREMELLRRWRLGFAHFRSRFFTENVKGIYDFTADEFDRSPALIPAMTWIHATRPMPPTSIGMAVSPGSTSTILSWQGARDRSDGPYLLYNVYSSRVYPVDITDADNLIAVRLQSTSIELPAVKGQRYYAVTAVDRYGNESEPIQMPQPQAETAAGDLLPCDGQTLRLPQKSPTMDADLIAIETLQGAIIATRPYRGVSIDIRDLPAGIYVIRSLNAQGVSHRLGSCLLTRP